MLWLFLPVELEIGPNETLFFGMVLQSDILGAEKYGFDSIWYNHRRKDTIGLHPLFEVETYPEFVKIMQNDFQSILKGVPRALLLCYTLFFFKANH